MAGVPWIADTIFQGSRSSVRGLRISIGFSTEPLALRALPKRFDVSQPYFVILKRSQLGTLWPLTMEEHLFIMGIISNIYIEMFESHSSRLFAAFGVFGRHSIAS